MSDIGVAEIPVDEDERPLPPPKPPLRNALLDGPILRTLLSLAWPNVLALTAGTCVTIAETSYIGRLGVESLPAVLGHPRTQDPDCARGSRKCPTSALPKFPSTRKNARCRHRSRR